MKTRNTLLALCVGAALPLAAVNAQENRTSDAATANQEQTAHPDAWLLTKVKAKFAGSDLVQATDINVDVQDNVVSLRGTVASKAEKDEAIRLAAQTEGVTRVDASGLVMEGAVGADAVRHDWHKDDMKKNNN